MSHSRVNSSTAFRLCDELRKLGIDTWLDVRDVQPGAKWNESVESAIRGAAGFVFLIGPPDSTDRWQAFEWKQVVDNEYYLDSSKPLIPVLIGNPEVPGFLNTRKALVLDDTPTAWEELASAIVMALNDPASSLDENKLELARQARNKALQSFREYSRSLDEDDVKQAGIRAIK